MKILYFGITDPNSTGRFYAKALRDLGHEVQTFDPEYFKTLSLFQKFTVKLRRAPLKSRTAWAGESLVELCRQSKFDWLFVLSENYLDPEYLETIRKENPEMLLTFHSHDNLFSNGILKSKNFFDSLKLYDVAFTNKTQNVSRYLELGARRSYFVPSAYEPTIHRPIPNEKSLYGSMFDVTFVGTYDGSRDKYLEAVGWERLHVWGNGWSRYPAYFTNRGEITPRAVYANEFADVVTHSKINLGLLREEADDRHTIRTFEIPACGGLQLAPRNDEILSFYDEDKEIVCFSTLDELKEKVDYLLVHEKERKKIAEAGYYRCVDSKNTYKDRIEEMCRLMVDQPAKKSATRTR